jgi:hypothetical protein
VKRDHLTPSPSLSQRERDRRSPLPHLPNVQTPGPSLERRGDLHAFPLLSEEGAGGG